MIQQVKNLTNKSTWPKSADDSCFYNFYLFALAYQHENYKRYTNTLKKLKICKIFHRTQCLAYYCCSRCKSVMTLTYKNEFIHQLNTEFK